VPDARCVSSAITVRDAMCEKRGNRPGFRTRIVTHEGRGEEERGEDKTRTRWRQFVAVMHESPV
jgi:hypothetical protein